jgi:hypothetical protein
MIWLPLLLIGAGVIGIFRKRPPDYKGKFPTKFVPIFLLILGVLMFGFGFYIAYSLRGVSGMFS